MIKKSAGLLLYRFPNISVEVFLVHPGGPFWKKKDLSAWSIPKGEIEGGEDPLMAAARETKEETGIVVDLNDCISLNPSKQKSGKIIYAWAKEADFEFGKIESNLFEMEWPPRSGIKKFFPEVDKAAWLKLEEAKRKITSGQLTFLEELEQIIQKNK
ncbi:MAG: NUDIX domain-containing protein [Ginsengibacter sp.]